MALGTFLAGCLIGALAATFLTHAEQRSLGSGSIPLSLADAFAQIQSGWTRPTQAPPPPATLGPARSARPRTVPRLQRATQSLLLF
jgi:hypothetical protein